MKTLSLLLFTLILVTGCASHKNEDMKDVTIEYSAVSRGFYQKISVANQSATIANSRDEKPITIPVSNADWKAITAEFEKVNVEEISNLKAPTEKRFYDGAAIANLIIKQKDTTYETPAFDHGFPPAQIEKLVTLLVALNKK